ncbi:uncharacterized protein [Mycetomoellerius zeteki]|uniref:uncharacterized protein n=1 Tax=Mycetomoellerius zeteki TaxID=64791 RepID=UPI00084E4177|nr:PREDICTED: uncharacterized protein LOC108724030 [Trachymyrmex zeteki]XP_018305661.1 PREDICTED: uncharacterized protein LOC108724030 [Trachymyrmex zeteki]XP_018305662.1 PREDICTED: uncharacterized protein LOC108724030 [Trachymyrmex zeteki]
MEKRLAQKSNGWCVVKECNKNNVEKRHLFRFPKERDKWLQWICACERLDLEAMGAEYAHRSYRVCHLHFEEKWYNISKTRAHLHPDAIPTKFFERNNASITTTLVKKKMDDEIPLEENICISEHNKINSDLQPKSFLLLEQISRCDIAKPSTSSSVHSMRRKESPREKKLQQRISKLKAKVKTMDERNRRLRKKIRNLTKIKDNTKLENKKL